MIDPFAASKPHHPRWPACGLRLTLCALVFLSTCLPACLCYGMEWYGMAWLSVWCGGVAWSGMQERDYVEKELEYIIENARTFCY